MLNNEHLTDNYTKNIAWIINLVYFGVIWAINDKTFHTILHPKML